MTIVYNVAMILFFIVCLALVVVILMQKKRGKGASAALMGGSGGGGGQTYWDKNKGSSAEGSLERWTKILGATFLILVTVIGFLD